jgi:hypothetical protein
VIEPIADMPPGTIGFRASGRLTRDEYREILVPALDRAVDSGEVRLMFVIGPEFERMESGALLEDAKTGLELGLRHLSAWKRTAVVTDVEWVQRSIHLFAWMAPGEVTVCGLDREHDARAWVAA